jgi:hypothetical protein
MRVYGLIRFGTAACLGIASVAAARQAAPPATGAGGRGPSPADTTPADATLGAYRSQRLNGKPLPVTDLATDDQGTRYLIEFDELILTLRPKGEFRAALRYRQTLAAKGDQLSRDPIQKMTVHGSWNVAKGVIRFVPDPARGGEGLRILDGTLKGRTIELPFDYRNGRVRKRASVVLLYNPNII